MDECSIGYHWLITADLVNVHSSTSFMVNILSGVCRQYIVVVSLLNSVRWEVHGFQSTALENETIVANFVSKSKPVRFLSLAISNTVVWTH